MFDGHEFLFHLYRGSELLQDSCVAEAKEELEKALAVRPQDPEGQGLLGVVYFRLGLFPRAIAIYENLIQAFPDDVTPRINLALCYLKTGQNHWAKEMLERVIQRVPDHKRAWGYLGLVFERVGDYPQAQAAFEQAGQLPMARRMEARIAGTSRSEIPPVPRAADASAPQSCCLHTNTTASLPRDLPLAAESSCSAGPSPVGPIALDGADCRSLRSVTGLDQTPPRPSEFAKRALLPQPATGATCCGSSSIVARVEVAFFARFSRIRALLPESHPFGSTVAYRQYRGRPSTEPLGGATPAAGGTPAIAHSVFPGGSSGFGRLDGRGHVLLSGQEGRSLQTWWLHGEFIYVRECRLVGFDGQLHYESGRLPGSNGGHSPMIQLAGAGVVVTETVGTVRSVDITQNATLVVAADQVLGWTGRLLPHALAPEDSPGACPGFVGFRGDGAVLLELA